MNKQLFIRRLAEFLVADQVAKGLVLAGGPAKLVDFAKEWEALRNASPVFGYPTVEEAEKVLNDFLMSATRCPNDTDGDGDCHLCHNLPGGCPITATLKHEATHSHQTQQPT